MSLSSSDSFTSSSGTPRQAANGYQHLHRVMAEMRANDVKVTVPDLLVLARNNDPFFAGSPGDVEKAEWFASLWERLPDGTQRAHIRRIHYLAFTLAVAKPDGMPYENTDHDWTLLNIASKKARELGYVDPLAFDDRRNGEPLLFAPQGWREPWTGTLVDEATWILPEVADLDFDATFPEASAYGFQYDPADQPVRVVLLIEKSTMNDVLVPLCEELEVDLLAGAGFESITRAIGIITRAVASRRPVRVFYVSDFDPAGVGMPVAAARHLEHRVACLDSDVDIKLTPIALNGGQVADFDLPRAPGRRPTGGSPISRPPTAQESSSSTPSKRSTRAPSPKSYGMPYSPTGTARCSRG